ncbi:hypothetical protein U9M48_036498 [Paspalum notatum var. saurae]|uniref:Uncharacterized protein n=1 Tax=Paspalum notatum var. saurae TaxID=547442 RepID=A0AAQ3X8E2_PASNO
MRWRRHSGPSFDDVSDPLVQSVAASSLGAAAGESPVAASVAQTQRSGQPAASARRLEAIATPARLHSVVAVPLRVGGAARCGASLHRSSTGSHLRQPGNSINECQPRRPLRTGGCGTMRGCATWDLLAADSADVGLHGAASMMT